MKSAPRLTSEMVAEVMTKGRSIKSDSFLFKYIYKPNDKARFGFVASKKNFPTAVERNRVKRRGRATLRRILTSLPLPSIGAFIFNKEVLVVSTEKLAEEIEQVLIKSGILVKP
ncbi:MAG: ribonuclease P protein component [Patescibacteria group bacterium]